MVRTGSRFNNCCLRAGRADLMVGFSDPDAAARTRWNPSRDRNPLVEIDVLDGVDQADSFGHRTLECLAAGDQADAAGALVDDGGADGGGEVVDAAAFAAGVEQRASPHVAVGELVATELDRVAAAAVLVGARQLGVHAAGELAVARAPRVGRGEAAVG